MLDRRVGSFYPVFVRVRSNLGRDADYPAAKGQAVPMAASNGEPTKFGTFGGVFTPCTLTILGVIMFLRLGQVVGTAGILQGVIIVLLSKVITSLTAFSLSAIATNTRVKAGGAYYLISRSLGAEFGGSIGIVFFIAQAISVAMYVLGFTEAFVGAFPGLGVDTRSLASLVNLVVFICVFIGAGWTIKVQYGILAILLLSLVSFFVGAGRLLSGETFAANLGSAYPAGGSFFTAFALFFPAATGIMAGANMSGDLQEPSRAIPRGTLGSIAVTAVIYVVMVFLLGAATSREELLTNNLIVRDISWIPLLITLGIFAATLSSALGSMMGAPRVLQALGRDRIFPILTGFGKGSGARKEPRRATILTFLLAQAGILLGDLNAIAPIITMFFMITYGYLNLATFYESLTKNPSYRPTFRLSHWTTALLGTVGCTAVMFLIAPLWAAISIALMGGLHWFVARKEIVSAWGDVSSGVAFGRARKNLLRLMEERYHPKNWRPSILCLSGAAGDRRRLPVFGHWLTGGRGMLTLAQIVPGDVDTHIARKKGQEDVLTRYIEEQELPAFPIVLVAPGIAEGIEALIQCYGIGAMRPNVVMMGWCWDEAKLEDFGTRLRTAATLGRSIVLARFAEDVDDPWTPEIGTVDVWWRGRDNGPLMFLLAHLLVQNDPWRGKALRVIRAIGSEAGREDATTHLTELIAKARIEAEALIVVGENQVELIRTASRRAAVVFVGFQPPEKGDEAEFCSRINELVGDLPVVLAVWSSGDASIEA